MNQKGKINEFNNTFATFGRKKAKKGSKSQIMMITACFIVERIGFCRKLILSLRRDEIEELRKNRSFRGKMNQNGNLIDFIQTLLQTVSIVNLA